MVFEIKYLVINHEMIQSLTYLTAEPPNVRRPTKKMRFCAENKEVIRDSMEDLVVATIVAARMFSWCWFVELSLEAKRDNRCHYV